MSPGSSLWIDPRRDAAHGNRGIAGVQYRYREFPDRFRASRPAARPRSPSAGSGRDLGGLVPHDRRARRKRRSHGSLRIRPVDIAEVTGRRRNPARTRRRRKRPAEGPLPRHRTVRKRRSRDRSGPEADRLSGGARRFLSASEGAYSVSLCDGREELLRQRVEVWAGPRAPGARSASVWESRRRLGPRRRESLCGLDRRPVPGCRRALLLDGPPRGHA